MTTASGGSWKYPVRTVSLSRPIARNQVPVYGEDYQKLALSRALVTMQRPPTGFSDVLFYPCALYKAYRDAVAIEVALPEGRWTNVMSSDRLAGGRPRKPAREYPCTREQC